MRGVRCSGAYILPLLLAAVAACSARDRHGAPDATSVGRSEHRTPSTEHRAPLPDTASAEDSLRFGAFGVVHLVRARAAPEHVLLFLSGDGGWDATARHIARQLAAADAVVVGIDDRAYIPRLMRGAGRCAYPASDLESLSQYVQKRLGRSRYEPPVVVGHSSGSAIAYAALAQAPPGTFRGAITLGFCATVEGAKPFCRVGGTLGARRLTRPSRDGSPPVTRTITELHLAPADTLPAPWALLSGARDEACSADSARGFAGRVAPASVVGLPSTGHGFGDPRAWLGAFLGAYARLTRDTIPAAPAAVAVRGLPLVEVPARGAAGGRTMAVVVSGDGGWAGVDREIAGVFAERGVPTVGLNSLQYFWRGSTPDSAARDLARIVSHYLAAWDRDSVVLVGYSRGADVLPFMAARLPEALRRRVRVVALLAPSRTASFEFHLADWLGAAARPGEALATAGEIARLRGTPVLCFYGTEERDSACPVVDPAVATPIPLAGGHHLGGDYRWIADRVLALPR